MIKSSGNPVEKPDALLAGDEVLYRQVGPGGNPVFYEPGREPPLDYTLFLPSRADVDGLSLIRQAHRAPVWAAFRPEQPAVRFRLAIVSLTLLQAIDAETGLTAARYQATPDALDAERGEPWGHAIAAHINRPAYDRDKSLLKSWARRGTCLIRHSSISGPFALPTVHDAYRPESSSAANPGAVEGIRITGPAGIRRAQKHPGGQCAAGVFQAGSGIGDARGAGRSSASVGEFAAGTSPDHGGVAATSGLPPGGEERIKGGRMNPARSRPS